VLLDLLRSAGVSNIGAARNYQKELPLVGAEHNCRALAGVASFSSNRDQGSSVPDPHSVKCVEPTA
jgi:hypothetical protein